MGSQPWGPWFESAGSGSSVLGPGKPLCPHCVVPQKGLKAIGPLVACFLSHKTATTIINWNSPIKLQCVYFYASVPFFIQNQNICAISQDLLNFSLILAILFKQTNQQSAQTAGWGQPQNGHRWHGWWWGCLRWTRWVWHSGSYSYWWRLVLVSLAIFVVVDIAYVQNFSPMSPMSTTNVLWMTVQWNLFITRSLGPWKYLVISGFSLYQGKKTKKYKKLGPAKLPRYKRICYIRPRYNEVPLY